LTANIEWHPIASSSMLGCAANQQQYSPEMTGFPAPTERHCCGLVEESLYMFAECWWP
jgi:hypothetical protein